MAIKQTAAYEPYAGYTTYEGSDFPGFDWTFNEEQGGWTKPTPNPNTPSQFSLEDIKNRSGYAFDPNQDKLVTDSADESLSPSDYYNKLAKDLSEASYGVWSINGNPSQYTELIEGLKEVDPKAYYTAKIDTLSRGVGHQYQSNQGARGDVVKQQLQDLIPEAQKAGLKPEEINSLFQSGYSQGAQGFSQILANQQSQGGPYTPLWEGLKFVGPGALGMYGIDQALIAGLGAAYGAGTGMSTVGLGSGIGGAAAMEGGALAAGAGSLGAGGFGGAGALSTAELLGSTGFTPTAGSSFAIDPTAAYTLSNAGTAVTQALPYTEAYDAFNLAKQGLNSAAIEQNLAATGLDSFLSADMANLAAQGLSPEAIAQNLAYSYSPAELAGTGIESLQAVNTGSGLLSKAGDVLKGAQVAKGLLGVGKNPLQPGSQPQPQMQMQGGRQYAGVDYAPILNLLNIQQPQRNRNSLLG
jgi:hypothetical protein